MLPVLGMLPVLLRTFATPATGAPNRPSASFIVSGEYQTLRYSLRTRCALDDPGSNAAEHAPHNLSRLGRFCCIDGLFCGVIVAQDQQWISARSDLGAREDFKGAAKSQSYRRYLGSGDQADEPGQTSEQPASLLAILRQVETRAVCYHDTRRGVHESGAQGSSGLLRTAPAA